MVGIVYSIENKINGKFYVGATTNSLKNRILAHKSANTILGKEIREIGIENFSIKTICECENLDELYENEKFWIEKLNCIFPNGYNKNRKGRNPTRFNFRTAPEKLIENPTMIFFRIIDGKWKIYILEKLLERPHRFNELKNSIFGIHPKVLIENLRQLEEDKIILRKVEGEKPPQKVEYFLSELGEKLRPLIFEIENFGIYYNEHK